MIYKFPAVFEYDKEDNKYINVFFPDLLGVFTFGEGMDDAMNMAKDALYCALENDDYRKITPSPIDKLSKYEVVKLVEVDK